MSDQMPMRCEEALRLLAAFLDGELERGNQEAVERHLESCRSCFSRADFERRLKAELGRLRTEEVTPDFQQRVQRLLHSFTTSTEPGDGS